jgi:hypothetical protein
MRRQSIVSSEHLGRFTDRASPHGMTVAPLGRRCLVTTPGRCDVMLPPAGDHVAIGGQTEVESSLYREGMG